MEGSELELEPLLVVVVLLDCAEAVCSNTAKMNVKMANGSIVSAVSRRRK